MIQHIQENAMKRVQHTERMSAVDAKKYRKVRGSVEAELPELVTRHKARMQQLARVMAVLREERVRQGLSFADMRERTGIERSTLCRIERDPAANPTVATLARIAEALGKTLVIQLIDAK